MEFWFFIYVGFVFLIVLFLWLLVCDSLKVLYLLMVFVLDLVGGSVFFILVGWCFLCWKFFLLLVYFYFWVLGVVDLLDCLVLLDWDLIFICLVGGFLFEVLLFCVLVLGFLGFDFFRNVFIIFWNNLLLFCRKFVKFWFDVVVVLLNVVLIVNVWWRGCIEMWDYLIVLIN